MPSRIAPTFPDLWTVRVLASRSGQGMVELLIVIPVMLLLIMGTIQVALIYHAKTTLNYAAFEAVRAGTLHCDKKFQDRFNGCVSDVGQFAAVQEGLARGLAPLYSYYEPDSNHRKEMKSPALNQVEGFQKGRNRIYAEMSSSLDLVRIERLNPTEKAFVDFAVGGVIPNDNLMFRSSSSAGGSEMSLQDANILHIRITYWYPLFVPFVNKLIFRQFVCGGETGGRWSLDPVCNANDPRIPLTATAVMRMQVPGENGKGWYSR